MGWMTKVIVLVALQYISPSSCEQGVPFPLDDAPRDEDSSNDGENYLARLQYDNINNVNNIEDLEDEKLAAFGNYLSEMLLLPTNSQGLPLLYIEDMLPGLNSPDFYRVAAQKRSRYYRKYPWKRQNARQTYDAENRYLCQPSKEDVYRLLVALHDARQGNKGRAINFCNRKRPATAIFTNIRFLG